MISFWKEQNRLILSIAVLFSIVLFFGPTDNWMWDPSYYYAQMRSPLVDRDLAFYDETIPADENPSVTGLQPSPWPIGPGLFWSPFFLIAHSYLKTIGHPSPNGFTLLEIGSVSAGSALYGILGVLVIYRISRFFAGKGVSLLTALLALYATPLIFYVYRQPIMAHSSSVLVSSLLVYVLLAIHYQHIPFHLSGLLIGTLIGLSILLRWSGVTLVLLPVVFWLTYAGEALAKKDYAQFRTVIVQAGISAGVSFLVFLPQMAFWSQVYGTWFIMPNTGFSENLFPVHLLDLFFHTNRGIFFWSPYIFVGMIGILFLKPIWLRIASLLFMGAYLFLLGAWTVWHGAGGYGPRYFIEILPITAIGVAYFLEKLWHNRKVFLISVAGLLIFHQLVLMTMVEQAWVSPDIFQKGEPIAISYPASALKQVIQNPLVLFHPRPYVMKNRQTMIVNLIAGERDWVNYQIPFIAMIIIPTGVFLYQHVERARLLPLLCVGIIVFMHIWFWFLLVLMKVA